VTQTFGIGALAKVDRKEKKLKNGFYSPVCTPILKTLDQIIAWLCLKAD
jgi:hypothetical protein